MIIRTLVRASRKKYKPVGPEPDFVVGKWYFYRRRGWIDCPWGSTRVDGWEVGLGNITCYGDNKQWVWAPCLAVAIKKAREDLGGRDG